MLFALLFVLTTCLCEFIIGISRPFPIISTNVPSFCLLYSWRNALLVISPLILKQAYAKKQKNTVAVDPIIIPAISELLSELEGWLELPKRLRHRLSY